MSVMRLSVWPCGPALTPSPLAEPALPAPPLMRRLMGRLASRVEIKLSGYRPVSGMANATKMLAPRASCVCHATDRDAAATAKSVV